MISGEEEEPPKEEEKKKAKAVEEIAPPPKEKEVKEKKEAVVPGEKRCKHCNSPLSYIKAFDNWYCYKCNQYESVKGAPLPPPVEEKEVQERKPASPEGKKEVPSEKKPEIIVEKSEPVTMVTPSKEKEEQRTEEGLRVVPVVYFYPVENRKEFEEMRSQINNVLSKHKLKFTIDTREIKSYPPIPSLNYSEFIETCQKNKVTIALLLGPPFKSTIPIGEFNFNIAQIFKRNNLHLQLIPFQDVSKHYKYLNLLLDIALIGHENVVSRGTL